MRSTYAVAAAIVISGGLVLAAGQGGDMKQGGEMTMANGKMADKKKIEQAMTAAPADIAATATIMDWPEKEGLPMTMLRAGTNGWTCMPSTPGTGPASNTADPMCLDKTFSEWAGAYTSRKDPHTSTVGIAYMLMGDKGASNTDPFATAPTAANDWIVSPPHVMVILPDVSLLNAYPSDPRHGGPWVMWKGTKYAHLMVPTAPMPNADKNHMMMH